MKDEVEEFEDEEPKEIPVRTRRLAEEIQRRRTRINPRYQLFLEGILDVEDLDDEELARGRLRDEDGQFRGPPPKVIPHEFQQRLAAEFIKRIGSQYRINSATAIETIIALMRDEKVNPRVRLQAAQTILERTLGRVPQQVVTHNTTDLEQVAMNIVVDLIDDGTPAMIEATVVDDIEEY